MVNAGLRLMAKREGVYSTLDAVCIVEAGEARFEIGVRHLKVPPSVCRERRLIVKVGRQARTTGTRHHDTAGMAMFQMMGFSEN